MRTPPRYWRKVIVAVLCLLAPCAHAMTETEAALVYETIQPSRLRLGESAIIRVTSLSGDLKSFPLPTVAGLTFEVLGRSESLEYSHGTAIPTVYMLIRVTPKTTGIFSIPGVTPRAEPLVLDVVNYDDADPSAFHAQKQPPAAPRPPAPQLLKTTPLPKGIQLKAGGAAFVQLVIPTRAVYVGESVPVDIEVGVRPGIVTSLNGLPTINGGDFTLNNLSKEPARRDQIIEGSPFLVMTWHSVLAPVKPGDFSLSVATPLSVKINTRSAEDTAFATMMGWPFVQSLYNGIVPKDITITSPSSDLKVLPLPTQGRPRDFSGAVGAFQASSEISPSHVAAGDPLTLRLHISGTGNFDRVDSRMFDHLEQWKTYPPRSSFTSTDAVGYKGNKLFEQPLIAAQPGEKSIPALEFSYFNPNTRSYERARTPAIDVTVSAPLGDSSVSPPAVAQSLNSAAARRFVQGLRPDHPRPQRSVGELRPLYFQASFLLVPTTLALILAGSWFAVRPNPARASSKAAERLLAQLDATARSGDAASFFELARYALLQAFAARWRVPPDQITAAELKARLGAAGEDIERLFALADETKYSIDTAGETDFPRWRGLIRAQLSGEGG